MTLIREAAPAWRVAGASIAGTAHAAEGGACEDRHRLHVTRTGMLIAVVSDGAGSAWLGGEGAALLCDHIVDGLDRHFHTATIAQDRATLLAACRAVQASVASAREAAAASGEPLSAFHATLVGAVVQPGMGGLFFHIGDRAALALAVAQDGARWLLSPPHNGAYANTTYFFTERDWRRHLRFKLIPPGYETIFVMSDGVTELALEGTEPAMPFLAPIGSFLAGASREAGELIATLGGEVVCARTHDDKTLIWARPHDAAERVDAMEGL